MPAQRDTRPAGNQPFAEIRSGEALVGRELAADDRLSDRGDDIAVPGAHRTGRGLLVRRHASSLGARVA